MGKLGEAVLEIRPDMRGLDSGLSAAEAKLQGFVGSTKRLMAGLAVGAAVGFGASQIVDATVKAMDFGETLSKVGASFGSSGKVIEKTADELASKFGLVKKTVMDGATSIGLVGQAAGMTSAQSARLGSDMVKLAADVESFANVPLEQVLAAFRSGMVGEAEPMRQFGVLMNEDAVKAEALRLGLTKTTGALSEQAKVMARVSLIKNSPAIQKMVGDLERTADSGKNQLRKFLGDLENLKTELGAQFIGPMTEAIKLARELGATLNETFKHDSMGSFGEELKAVINALRIVNKVQTAKPGELRGKSLQGVADEVVGAQKTGGYGKGELADKKRAEDHNAHVRYLQSKGVDTSKMFFHDQGSEAGKAEKAAKSQAGADKFKAQRQEMDAYIADQAKLKAARSKLTALELKYLDWAGSQQGSALLQLGKAGLFNIASKGLVGGLSQTGKELEESKAKLDPPKEKPSLASSQTFDSSADFAKFAMERAAESQQMQEQTAELKKQTAIAAQSGTFLQGIKEGVGRLIGTASGGMVFRTGKV